MGTIIGIGGSSFVPKTYVSYSPKIEATISENGTNVLIKFPYEVDTIGPDVEIFVGGAKHTVKEAYYIHVDKHYVTFLLNEVFLSTEEMLTEYTAILNGIKYVNLPGFTNVYVGDIVSGSTIDTNSSTVLALPSAYFYNAYYKNNALGDPVLHINFTSPLVSIGEFATLQVTDGANNPTINTDDTWTVTPGTNWTHIFLGQSLITNASLLLENYLADEILLQSGPLPEFYSIPMCNLKLDI